MINETASSSCVEPERFELSSKHGTRYAFYMLSRCSIFGKGKVSSSPVPSSLGACFRPAIAPLAKLVPHFDAPYASPAERQAGGTKAELILN